MQTQKILFFTFLVLVVFWIVSCDDGKKNNNDLSLLIALVGQSSPNKEIVEPKVALNTAELKMQGQTYALGNTLCSKNGIAASAGANLLVDTGNSLIDFSKNSGVIIGPGGAGQIDFYVNLPADTYRVSTQCAATITKNDSKNYGLRFSNCPIVAQLNPGNSPVIGAIDFEIYCTKIN